MLKSQYAALSKLKELSNDVLKEYFYELKFSSSSNVNYFVRCAI